MDASRLTAEQLELVISSIKDGIDLYEATKIVTGEIKYLTDDEILLISEALKGAIINYNLNIIVDGLIGSCMETVDSQIQAYYPGHDESNLTDDQLEEIHSRAYVCDCCGWWCEVGDYGNCGPQCSDGEDHGEICRECHESEFPEEEEE